MIVHAEMDVFPVPVMWGEEGEGTFGEAGKDPPLGVSDAVMEAEGGVVAEQNNVAGWEFGRAS